MPPTPLPDGYAICTMVYVINDSGQELVTTFGVKNVSLDDVATIAATVGAIWAAAFTAASTCDSYTLSECRVLSKFGGFEYSASHAIAQAGSNSAEPPSPAVAVGITKGTIFAGRKYRGRFYLPAGLIDRSAIEEGGTLTSGQVTSLQTAIDHVLTDLAGADLPMVLIHRDLSTPTEVNTVTVRANCRTQRRRQRLT